MKFYINNNEVQIEVAPNFTETLDETLDSASVILKANSQRLPYAPMQTFTIVFENQQNEKLVYYIASDTVDIYSNKPLTYKHTLNLIQNTKVLEKYLIRNSVFSQPAYKYKRSMWADSKVKHDAEVPASDVNYICQNLSSGEHIKRAFIELDCSCYKNDYLTKIFSENGLPSGITQANLYVIYNDSHNNLVKERITPSHFGLTQWVYWEKLELRKSYVDYLIGEGATNIRVGTYNNGAALNSSVHYVFDTFVYLETYKYTCYDILNLMLKRQQNKRTGVHKTFTPLFNLPQANTELYELLTTTVAPNISFTQCTMYEAVAEIFKLFDAIFTLDENNYLGIEYFNENTNANITKDFTGARLTITESDNNSGLVAYYQNAKVEHTYPDKNGAVGAKTTILGVPNSQEWVWLLDKPIDNIIRAEVMITQLSGANGLRIVADNWAVDITDFIFEDSIYSLLEKSVDAYLPSNFFTVRPQQYFTTHYSKNSKIINISDTQKWVFTRFNYTRMIWVATMRALGITTYDIYTEHYGNTNTINNIETFTSTPQWNLQALRLTYFATTDGRTKVSTIEPQETDGEYIVNQANGDVDLNKLGLNIFGLSLKNGQPTFHIKQEFSNWADRIKKGQIYVDSNNNKWIANVCSYTFLNTNKISADIEFVKNYNSLSKRIQLDRAKRLSNISSELTIKSEDNIVEYLYITPKYKEGISSYSIALDPTSICATFGISSQTDYPISSLIETDKTPSGKLIYIPMVKYVAGNMFCFEMSFDSPISAGNATTVSNNEYHTKAVKYTDDYGEFTRTNILFTKEYGNGTDVYLYNSVDFPLVDKEEGQEFSINNLEVYKQPNEIFALNYEIAVLPFKSEKDIFFIGREFMNNCVWITERTNTKAFRIYYANDNFKYSILDTKAHGTNFVQITSVQNYVGGSRIDFNFSGTIVAKNWALTDDLGNIYFACNDGTIFDNNKLTIYFYTDSVRI